MGHLNGILARVGGNLNNDFQKSQMPGGLPGGDVEASIRPIHKQQSTYKTTDYRRCTSPIHIDKFFA